MDITIGTRVDRSVRAQLSTRVPRDTDNNPGPVTEDDAIVTPARPWYPALLAVTATVAALASILGALLVTGLNGGYEIEVASRKQLLTSQQFAGFDLVEGDVDICGAGEDFWACASMHNTMWNALCTGPTDNRTASAEATCDRLRAFVDNLWQTYETCGYGCETRVSGIERWGWAYMRPEPSTLEKTPPPDAYTDTCYFVLGDVKIGYCPKP